MPWVGPAASLISTVADLNRFFGLLLAGEIVSRSSLAQMQSTVPVISQEGRTIDYGLGCTRWIRPAKQPSGAMAARCGVVGRCP
jgi:D-alanyl-D-alanine carboxypeptidase